MNRSTRAVRAALATMAMTASVAAVTATDASAIEFVNCGVRTDFLKITWHNSSGPGISCLANGGEIDFGPNSWITRISTGNNRVQWHGDGRWQPAAPIAKNTVYQWPNHPDGVKIEPLRV